MWGVAASIASEGSAPHWMRSRLRLWLQRPLSAMGHGAPIQHVYVGEPHLASHP